MSLPHLSQPITPLNMNLVKNLIYTIEDETPIPVYWDGITLSFTGYGRIDDDGPGSAHNDPDHQGQTSLRHNGASIDADTVRYAVIPLSLIPLVKGEFLGCQVWVTYKGIRVSAVCADAGPPKRGGEGSIALWKLFPGVNLDANTGGIDSPEVLYEFMPGFPAIVNGITYALQSA